MTKQDSISLLEIRRDSECVCGLRGTLSEILEHQKTWRRHGVCLYPVAVMRARRAGYDTYVPIPADPKYYTEAWLRIRKGMVLNEKEGIEWALTWYLREDLEFCIKFMQVGEVSRWKY